MIASSSGSLGLPALPCQQHQWPPDHQRKGQPVPLTAGTVPCCRKHEHRPGSAMRSFQISLTSFSVSRLLIFLLRILPPCLNSLGTSALCRVNNRAREAQHGPAACLRRRPAATLCLALPRSRSRPHHRAAPACNRAHLPHANEPVFPGSFFLAAQHLHVLLQRVLPLRLRLLLAAPTCRVTLQ